MLGDDLAALLRSRRWIARRVDRVEFLDLTTVRRTIALTLDLDELARVRTPCHATSGGPDVLPLGWFMPWANAGTALVDAEGRTLPYLTSRESDCEVERQIERRLDAIGLGDLGLELRAVPRHRSDPGRPGDRCDACRGARCSSDGHQDLMIDKWGCRAVLRLLDRLHEAGPDHRDAQELARILLAWQRNFVLFACIEGVGAQRGRTTLRLSYDEELLEWEPPWEHRQRVVHKPAGRACTQPDKCRAYVSRGGPFAADLDLLTLGRGHGLLAKTGWPRLRKIGRRGLLHPVWHVAWHQASGMDVSDHRVDVVLPNELAAVRMRMLRMIDRERRATIADQAGSRPTIVAPQPREDDPCAQAPDDEPDPWSPTLFSLVLAQRSPAAWYGGAWIAALTAVGLLVVAGLWMRQVAEHADAGVAALLLAPTLVAAALSVRAGSEIAEQLTTMLRRLIACVSVLAATCAVAVIVGPGRREPNVFERLQGTTPPIHHLWWVRGVWLAAGVLLLIVAGALVVGARRIKRLLADAWRPAPRYLPDAYLGLGQVLNRRGVPQIGPPDCWLNADEGDLAPWGWLDGPSDRRPAASDDAFWKDAQSCRARLVGWVQEILGYEPAPSDRPPCPQCCC